MLRSTFVQDLLKRHGGDTPVPAGTVIVEILQGHPDYVDRRLGADELADIGPVRSVSEHLDLAESCWDPATNPSLTSRRVVIGLALDPAVGGPVVSSGVLHGLIESWQPMRLQRGDPDSVVWDLLTDAGRAAADEQPLLAAALGAPAEWSVDLPGDVSAIAWSPDAEQIAVLAGGVVHRCGPDGEPARIGVVGEPALGIGWGRSGVIALHLGTDGTARLVRLPDGQVVGTFPGVLDARIAGDGSGAWLLTTSGLLRWTHTEPSPVPLLDGPGQPLTVNYTGRAGLVEQGPETVLVVGAPRSGQPNGAEADPAAGMIRTTIEQAAATSRVVQGPPNAGTPPGASAILRLGADPAAALAEPGGGVGVHLAPFPPVARIATGPEPVTALASDPTGTRLAVAIGRRVEVWPLGQGRAVADRVPRYDSDRPEGPDLLEADRDARAIAGLMASEQLKPPLAIGLFGPWGSGKSFVISRIKHFLGELTGSKRTQGYLTAVRVIDFNAWNYAEANLWASMVDQVFTDLQKVEGVPPPKPAPEVVDARALAEEAERQAKETDRGVQAAERELREARVRLAWRRLAGISLALLVLVLLVAVFVVGPARFIAIATGALALLGLVAGLIGNARRVWGQARDVVDTGRSGWRAVERVMGKPAKAAVRARDEELQRRQEKQAAAREHADRLAEDAARVEALATAQPLGTVLRQLSTVTAYRDELGLVTRTKAYFGEIDTRIRESRKRREVGRGTVGTAGPRTGVSAEGTTEGAGDEDRAGALTDVQLDRIVILIDDLDRCAPEKVVTVLEAVHLLFDFEMFVVLIAVDTRWLEQSLRIRYRQLLGRAGTAAPSDYLEKIIQVPLHLLPLDGALVRTLIANLTGTSVDAGPAGAPDGAEPPRPAVPAPGTPAGPSAIGSLTARRPRPRRAALPAEVLRITQEEATAMSAVAPLVGTTPRTVKRFVNTYQLLKARAVDPAGFDAARDGLGDHEVVAFLLALVTGHPAVGARALPALRGRAPGLTLQTAINAIVPPAGTTEQAAAQAASLAAVQSWLASHPDYARAPAERFADWAAEVARFSFTPPGMAEPVPAVLAGASGPS